MKGHFAALAALALAACSATPPSLPEAGSAPRGIDTQIAEATVAPLTDLNIVRAEIPEVLAAARAAPYAMPADLSCPGLAAGIRALDAVLGADLDTPETRNNPSLVERGGDAASNALVGAVRDTTEGVVPFRGWVRKLSGAERYARKVSASIAAGTVRRAYLKGLGQAAGCMPPAAPRPAPARPAEQPETGPVVGEPKP